MAEPLRSITEQFVCGPDGIDPMCPRCGGCGYVCEDHPEMPWQPMHGLGCDCGAAGMPCAGPFGPVTAGESTCPVCGRHWTVTPYDDCLVPACGHYGDDTSAANPDRPCHRCGLAHAWMCVARSPVVGVVDGGSADGGEQP